MIMMRIVGRIIRDLRREEITKLYANKNRYIPQNIYTKLKIKRNVINVEKDYVDYQRFII